MEKQPSYNNKEMSPQELADWNIKDTAELKAQKEEAEKARDEKTAKRIGGYIATNEKQLRNLTEDIAKEEEPADVEATITDVADDTVEAKTEKQYFVGRDGFLREISDDPDEFAAQLEADRDLTE